MYISVWVTRYLATVADARSRAQKDARNPRTLCPQRKFCGGCISDHRTYIDYSGEAPRRPTCYFLMVSCVFCNGSRVQPQLDLSTMSFSQSGKKEMCSGSCGYHGNIDCCVHALCLIIWLRFVVFNISVHRLTSSVAINDQGSPVSSPSPAAEISISASKRVSTFEIALYYVGNRHA